MLLDFRYFNQAFVEKQKAYQSYFLKLEITEGPFLMLIFGLEKNQLHKIHFSRTVGDALLTQKSPTCMYT